jgi:glycosyltransferase involved in cell wall biosynthesis
VLFFERDTSVREAFLFDAVSRLRSCQHFLGRALSLLVQGDRKRIISALRARFAATKRRFTLIEIFSDEPNERFEASKHRHDAPLVSVIIPCFNYGRFLTEAIDSVLAQTLTDTEIIVVEGGSTDNETFEIVKNLKRPRTQILFQSVSQLVGENRNFGIKAARGKYVCCLDADDTIAPTYLEKAVYLLESERYDVVSTGIQFIGTRDGKIDVLKFPTLRDMTEGNHVITCAVFRRELWEAVNGYFDTGTGKDHVAEDWDFWIRIAASGARIRNITGEHLFNYRIHAAGSLSSALDVKDRDDQRLAIIARNEALLTEEAFARSTRQASRRLLASTPGGDLLHRECLRAPDSRSLLIAVPLLIVGGAERLLASLVRHLVARNWRVTVISTVSQKGHPSTSSWFTEHSSEVYMLPQFIDPWEYDDFIRYLLCSRKFDVVLIAGSHQMYELLPEIANSHPKTAVVDLLFNTQGHTASHTKFQAQLTFALGEQPEVMEWYRARKWPADRTRLIESGIDLSLFRPERPECLAAALGIGPQDIVIGFSGRLSSEKAPDIFLQIAAALRDEPRARFVMTGTGPLLAVVKSQLAMLPSGTRIDFMGYVENTTDYFSLYDVFVLPSRLDGRPIALLEAISSGCAIVASRVGGVPALIEGSGAGILCNPANVIEFAATIRGIVADPANLAKMKRHALATAKGLLSETEMGDRYIEAFEAAIALKQQNCCGAVAYGRPQGPIV